MSKENKAIRLAVAVACLVSTGAIAQQSSVPGMPAMPSPVSAVGGASGNVPMAQPAMPVPVMPATPSVAAAPVSGVTSMQEGNVQRNILRMISEKKAELDLLKLQAEIDKFKKPQEDAIKKDDAAGITAALEQAKKEQAQSVVAVEQGPSVTLLATYGMPEVPGASFAELKVGDLLVNAKVGDRLPSGHFVTAIHFDSVEISKNKKAKKGDTLYISATDAASVYASRPKSGQATEASSASRSSGAPANLPPMPAR